MRFDPPKKAYSGYIFDFDGTLVDSMPLHFRAWRHAFEKHGAPFDFSWELFLSRAGMGLEETVVELNREFGSVLDPRGVVTDQRAYHSSHLLEVEPIEEVLDFARSRAHAAPLAIASGGAEHLIRKTLTHLGLLDLFRFIVTPADVDNGKPAPDMFLRCAHLFDLPVGSCLVVEDGEMGFVAARAAGMDFVVVATS